MLHPCQVGCGCDVIGGNSRVNSGWNMDSFFLTIHLYVLFSNQRMLISCSNLALPTAIIIIYDVFDLPSGHLAKQKIFEAKWHVPRWLHVLLIWYTVNMYSMSTTCIGYRWLRQLCLVPVRMTLLTLYINIARDTSLVWSRLWARFVMYNETINGGIGKV